MQFLLDFGYDLRRAFYLQSDLMSFAETLTRGRLNGPKAAVMSDIYKLYVDRTVNDYEEHHLAENNTDFRNLMAEPVLRVVGQKRPAIGAIESGDERLKLAEADARDRVPPDQCRCCSAEAVAV